MNVYNPYLPLNEYVPDGEPHIFEGRLYIFGSHDRIHGSTYCMEPYVAYSCPLEDLGNFTCHGVIYDGKEDPLNDTKEHLMFAPDVTFYKGRYYLYYGLDTCDSISIAVANKPYGPFRFYGHVQHPDGTIWGKKIGDGQPFDPGIFIDDDERIYLYSGFSTTPEVLQRIKKRVPPEMQDQLQIGCDGSRMVELEPDMKTIRRVVFPLIPGVANSQGTGFEGHEFFEASSMRKFENTYYYIYSSVQGHELCYAMSEHPDTGFKYGGILHDNGDLGLYDEPQYYHGNNHGSLIEINGRYYVFGHRHTDYSSYSRQGVADPIERTQDGRFHQAIRTSSGLNNGPLPAEGCYPASIACILKSKSGAVRSDARMDKTAHPAITEKENMSCITNIKEGTVIGYRWFRYKKDTGLSLLVRSEQEGVFELRQEENGPVVGTLAVHPSSTLQWQSADCMFMEGDHELVLRYVGEGAVDLFEVRFEQE